MVFNPLTSYEDPGIVGLPMLGTPGCTPGSIASCTLQAYAAPSRVFVATFTIAYASVPATAFTKTHGMQAGDIVIVVGNDVTHVWTLGLGGTRDVVY